MAKILITALPLPAGAKGDPGEPGERGPNGLPGINAVPADEAVAGYLSTPGSASRTYLDARLAAVGGGSGGGSLIEDPSDPGTYLDSGIVSADPDDEGFFVVG
jgi:hypothetical protein